MKKLTALLLILCMVPVFAFAKVSNRGEYPITDDDVTLKVWLARTPQTVEPSDIAQTKWYEEFSGVKVEWVVIPSEEMEMMFNLAISDKNNMPDVFLYAVDPGEIMNLVEDGIILPLDDLMEEHGYYYPKMLEELDCRDLVTAPDGHIYTFLASVALVQNSMYNKTWVLKDWLYQYNKAKGQDEGIMPQTIDEYYDMLLYFKENDMNGNGDPNDEIPLTGNYNAAQEGSDPMFYLMGSYLHCPHNFIVADNEHNVSLACTDDSFREGLKLCNKLYEEGLFAPEIFTQTLTQMRQVTSVYKSEAVAGVVAGMSPLRVVNISDDPERVSYDDYIAIPPVAGPDGVRVTPCRAETQLDLRCFITTACEHPDIAYKWLDYWSSTEGSTWCSWLGQENVHWKWAEEPSFGGDNKSVKSIWNWTVPQDVYWTITWFAQYYITEDMFFAKAAANTYSDNELAGNLAEQAYKPYSILSNIPQIAWCDDADLIAEKAEMTTLFNDYILNSCSKFIMGSWDIDNDADWQSFQDGLKRMDLDRYMEVLRIYYWGE
jgi:putative aldouronate transport system substrate-binding protein